MASELGPGEGMGPMHGIKQRKSRKKCPTQGPHSESVRKSGERRMLGVGKERS